MSEVPGQGDPFETAIQDGFRVPSWEELTPEQQQAIIDGPGQIEDPYDEILDFETLDNFENDRSPNGMHARNNWYINFMLDRSNAKQREDYIAAGMPEEEADELTSIWVPKPPVRRFQVIFPEMAADIDEHMGRLMAPNGVGIDPDKFNNDPEILRKLFVAYKLTRQLVDRSDDKNLQPGYLAR